jgi:hypothetical protein
VGTKLVELSSVFGCVIMTLLSDDAWISEVPDPFAVLFALQIVTDSDMTLHNVTVVSKQKTKTKEQHCCHDLCRRMQAYCAVILSNSRGRQVTDAVLLNMLQYA